MSTDETLTTAITEPALSSAWRRSHLPLQGTRVRGVVIEAQTNGVVVALEGVGADGSLLGLVGREGLLPRQRRMPLQSLVGQVIEGAVTEVDLAGEFVRVSPCALVRSRFMPALAAGERLRGRFAEVTWGGAYVEVDGALGYLPRSQLSRSDAKRYPHLVGRPWRGHVLDETPQHFRLTSQRRSRATEARPCVAAARGRLKAIRAVIQGLRARW